jgi:tripartite-type tricarboxylate transporter receptor subunit TctC
MTFVPYSGDGPVLNALLGGHVTSMLNSYSTSSAQLKAGKLRPLATATRTRIGALPDTPTVAELGYPDYEVDFWIGMFAPAKTPKQTVSHLYGHVIRDANIKAE